ncbi:MAG: HlyD family efflux transporter periplasmic adaptor subunit [Rhizobacter sp.]|nr:HlyD family efflux transporter periplasmic adaptor subunit [Rhizobacter sp.]MBP6268883.1 HlyD family efflux transporter periplasmic adaptor subunit [Rhizobacter sp.]
MSGLFRTESVEHQSRSWLGGIQLVRPVPLALLTGLVACTAMATGLFLFQGEYTRKAHVLGVIVPDRGLLRLPSPAVGTVVERRVSEGDPVRAGDVLFVVSVDKSTLKGDAQSAVQGSLDARQRSLQDARAQSQALEREQVAALTRQIEDMRRELQQMDGEAELQQQRLALALKAQARLESLQAENFVSSAHVQTRAEEVLGLRAQAVALARQRTAHQREIAALEALRREKPLQAQSQRGTIDRDLAELAQESAQSDALQRIVVRAPQTGVVTAVLAAPGDSVSPAAALASLLPEGARMQAELFAPSSAVGFLRPRQAVQLRYQAFPFQKFGHHPGQVLQVSRTPLQAAELASLPLATGTTSAAPDSSARPPGEPLYRITVELDRQTVQAYGVAQPLVAGMQLEADVLLDRRRLIEWIFEPLLSVSGRL